MQEVDRFNYQGVTISMNSGVGEELVNGVLEERKVWGTMARLWKENMMSRKVKSFVI